MFGLFRKKPAETQLPNSDCYVYIRGKAYVRRGDLIMCCDFRQPHHKWSLLCRLGTHVDVSEHNHIIAALGLIEGIINVTPMAEAFSRQSLN
jgi:hypothetical protein